MPHILLFFPSKPHTYIPVKELFCVSTTGECLATLLVVEKYGLIMFLRFPTLPINVKQGPHCEKFPQNGVFDDFFTNWWKMPLCSTGVVLSVVEHRDIYAAPQ